MTNFIRLLKITFLPIHLFRQIQDVYKRQVFTNLLLKYPNLSNKELFLFLETSSSYKAKNLHLVRNSIINHKKIFSDKSIYTEEFLNKYFSMTKRGQNYDV